MANSPFSNTMAGLTVCVGAGSFAGLNAYTNKLREETHERDAADREENQELYAAWEAALKAEDEAHRLYNHNWTKYYRKYGTKSEEDRAFHHAAVLAEKARAIGPKPERLAEARRRRYNRPGFRSPW